MNTQDTDNNDSVKCQYITLDAKGNITASCDTLFEVADFSKSHADKKFPFLSAIIKKLNKRVKSSDPLFIPDIDFNCDGFHSICDFTFMKTIDARGIKKFVWMIYDNSVHYRELIKPGEKILKKTAGILKLTLL
jgi:hypothetical protein